MDVDTRGHPESCRIQIVPHEHSSLVAPYLVGREPPPAHFRMVNHIVVKQGSRMNEFDNGRKENHMRSGITRQPGGYDHQEGSESFTAAFYDMGGHIADIIVGIASELDQAIFNGQQILLVVCPHIFQTGR